MSELPPLPEPEVVRLPGDDEGFSDEAPYLWAWLAHGYDTGMEPYFSAEQMQAYASAAVQAAQPEAVGEPVAQVADVYMSRYTIEWTNGPLPEGTNLYAAPVTLVEQGKPIKPSNAWAYPKDSYAMPVLFNPYTGEPRDARDVQSDPRGVLIAPPGKALPLAAEPETVGRPCKVGGGCVPTATSDCACRELAAPTPEPMSAPTAPAQAEFKLPAWTDEAPDWCTPKEAEVWQMGYDCAMGSARSMNSPETISAVLHVPSGVTFEKVIAAVRSEDLVSLTPTAPAPTEPVAVAVAGLGNSLLRAAGSKPTMCYCPPGVCQAPKPQWCINNRECDQLATPPSAAAQPEAVGWRRVPIDPTEAMLKAGVDAFQHSYSEADILSDWRACFRAMLAAAPTTESQPAEADERSEREVFEAWMRSIGKTDRDLQCDGWNNTGEYSWITERSMWAAWQARALAAPTAPAPTEPDEPSEFAHWLNARRDLRVSQCFHEIVEQFAALAALAAPPSAAAQPDVVGLTDNDLERIFEDAGGKWNGDMWTIEDADFHPAMRSLLAAAPTEPMSAPTAEPVATLWVQMETHDMGQSLAPNPPFKAAIAEAHTAAKDLPLGEYLLYATPPSAATPEPSDAERYQLVRRGQHWSVIDGIGNVLRGDDLDAAIDSIRASKGGKL